MTKELQLKRSRQLRGQSGVIGLTVCVIVVVVAMGIFFCSLIGVLGGARELQNATDSAALSVSRQQIKNGVALNSMLEKQNFWAIADNGQINLLNYNRVVGQLLLVSLNAQAEQAKGSTSALTHANQLWYAVQGSNASLSKRLSAKLMDSNNASTSFQSILGASNLTMLGDRNTQYQHDKYNVAYMNAGESTNVYLDNGVVPAGADLPDDCLSKPQSQTSRRFIKGYTAINIGGAFTIEGAPVMPNAAPHLVSDKIFASHKNAPATVGCVPPNAFQSACDVKVSNSKLAFNGCAIVGTLQSQFAASIPGGYLEVSNGGGSTGTIMELLVKSGLPAQEVLVPQVVQRLRQIQPAMSEEAICDWLDSVKLAPNKMAYIYFDAASSQFKADSNRPATYVPGTVPDGKDQLFSGASTLTYTPSSGYNNLLAVISLKDNLMAMAAEQNAERAKAADAAREKEEHNLIVRAEVDRAKAQVALQHAKGDEEKVRQALQNSFTALQEARTAAAAAQKSNRVAREAMEKALQDVKNAKSESDKAAALDRQAAAEQRLSESNKVMAEKDRALNSKENEQAERFAKLAEVERKRADSERSIADKDRQLAALALDNAHKLEHTAHPSTTQTAVSNPIYTTINQQPMQQQFTGNDGNVLKQEIKSQYPTKNALGETDKATSQLTIKEFSWK